MAGDLFGIGVQIPNLTSGQARPADLEGFLRVYAKNDKLYGVKPDGSEVLLSGEVGSSNTATQLLIDGGEAGTIFQDYLLRFDFGRNGANINTIGSTE